jgi:hypothetical protein
MDFGVQVCRLVITLSMRDARPHQVIAYKSILNEKSVVYYWNDRSRWYARAEGALISQTSIQRDRSLSVKCDSVSNTKRMH